MNSQTKSTSPDPTTSTGVEKLEFTGVGNIPEAHQNFHTSIQSSNSDLEDFENKTITNDLTTFDKTIHLNDGNDTDLNGGQKKLCITAFLEEDSEALNNSLLRMSKVVIVNAHSEDSSLSLRLSKINVTEAKVFKEDIESQVVDNLISRLSEGNFTTTETIKKEDYPAFTSVSRASKSEEGDESVYFDAVDFQPDNQPGKPPLSPEIMEVLSQADEQSMVPDRDTTEPIFLNGTAQPKKIKKRRRRKKWYCCCCRRKKAEREPYTGDSELQNESQSDISSSGSWTGCLGMLDSRSGEDGDEQGDQVSLPVTPSVNLGGNNRRIRIPDRPNYSLNLWSFLKNSLGKELSKIPIPVNLSEPLSMLQRLTEDYEYSDILDRAAKCEDPAEQLCYVAAFTISSYASTSIRTGKPFNPLLGETYEWDRMEDLGWRCICEQVSHHPPTAALYCEGIGWTCWQEFTMTSKFRGNSLEIIPLGCAHLIFTDSGNKYEWRKVTTVVHNIILGKLWVDQIGEMVITNHKNGDKCQLNYVPFSIFSKKQKEVTGTAINSAGSVEWEINGTWDLKVEASQIKSVSLYKNNDGKLKGEKSFLMATPTLLWTRRPQPLESERYYNFTQFAVQMNEVEPGVAPTDSRLRPDQRLTENGKWDEANAEKVRLEEKQRNARKKRAEEEEKSQPSAGGVDVFQPTWFQKDVPIGTGTGTTTTYTYKGEYWDCKIRKDWSRCPDIF